MKTKIKLVVLFIFLFSASRGQTKWVGLSKGFPNSDLDEVYDIQFDSQNNAYIIGYNSGLGDFSLWKHSLNTWQNLNIIVSPSYPFTLDKNNQLWVADDNVYLNYYDTITQNLIPAPSGTFFYDKTPPVLLTIDKNNAKWLGCSQEITPTNFSWCICKYDGSAFTAYDSTVTGIIQQPPAVGIYPNGSCIVAANNSSNLFITGNFNYIVKYDGSNWSKIDSSNSNLKGSIFIREIKMDLNDNLWMIVRDYNIGNCMVMYDGIQFHYYYAPPSFPPFGNLVIDPFGNKWARYEDGLIKFDGNNWTFFDSYQDAMIGFPEGCLASDSNGVIFIGNNGALGDFPITLFNENSFQTINGNVFKDANANGVHDLNENGIAYEIVKSSEGMCAVTDSVGDYHLYFTDSSNTITINHNLIKYRYHSTVPTSYSVNPLTQSTIGKDFGVAEVSNVKDVQLYSNLFPTRPGFKAYGHITYKNVGTTTLSDTITLQLDGRYNLLNAFPLPVLVNGNKLQWLYSNLAPMQYGGITLDLRVDSNAIIGDTLFSMANINPIVGDSFPSDNVNYIYKVVHGSYDPNEKEVEPKGTGPNGNIPNGQTLNYTIHFQNTGTDTAFTITVKDTLSSNLDINTFQFTGSSHPCIYEINGTGNIKFTFYNILLTDTFTNELLSHGYVSYKIKVIDNLPLGTEIKNTAFIYFDFNPPIVTNTTLNTIANTTGIPFIKNDYSANVFPNPLQDVATLEINGMNLSSKLIVKLYDAMGREMNVAVSKIDNNSFAIHRNDLKSGLYFYKVMDGSILISSGKITVQ